MANNGIFYSSGNTLNFTTNSTTWATLSSGGTFSSLELSATTYQNLPVSALTGTNGIAVSNSNSNFTLRFTGGTITGSTNFTNGLTATTISATTYQNLPFSGTVRGSGTVNYIPKWTGSTSLGDSLITDNGSVVTIPNVVVNSSFEFISPIYEGRVEPYYNLVLFDTGKVVKPLANQGFGGAEDLTSNSIFLTLSNDSDSRAIEILYNLRSTNDDNFRSGKIIANWNKTYTNFYQTEYGPNYDLTTMTFIDPPRVSYAGSGTAIRIRIDFDDVTDPLNLLTARFKYTLI